MTKKIALVSVFHKEGIVDFAKFLLAHDYMIYASGGTSKTLTDAGVPNTDVATLVGGGAILGHKVVTLSREIHAGLLADPAKELEELSGLGIPFIDLVCVDLYPLELAIKQTPNDTENIISKTDIGGPSMLSSGAKGRRIVVCDPTDRQKVMDWIDAGEPDKKEFVKMLAAKADYIVSRYRLLGAEFHSRGKYSGMLGESYKDLRYGENAIQSPSALYKTITEDPLAMQNFRMHAGNPSFINITDVDRTLQTITHIMGVLDVNNIHGKYAGVAVKHGNPCGASVSDSKIEAVKKVIDGNKRSIFGGTVMLNFEVDEEIAELLIRYGMEEGAGAKRRPLDVVAAPSVTDEAIKILQRQNDRCLIMTNPALLNLDKNSMDISRLHRQVRGGWIEQPNYTYLLDLKSKDISKYGTLNSGADQVDIDTLLGFAVCSTSNSNTVTIVKDGMLIANGVGQQDRVGAVELALKIAKHAEHDVSGAVAVSDSFFPFPDAPKLLKDAGIARILATSGSINDKMTIDLFEGSSDCQLLHIPDKQARMFFGH